MEEIHAVSRKDLNEKISALINKTRKLSSPTLENALKFSWLKNKKKWRHNKRLWKKYNKHYHKYLNDDIRREIGFYNLGKAMSEQLQQTLCRQSFLKRCL